MEAVKNLQFERAAELRDIINDLKVNKEKWNSAFTEFHFLYCYIK